VIRLIKIQSSIFIDAPVEKVVKYATDLENLPHWAVNISDVIFEKGKSELGTIANLTYTMLGLHMPVTIEVTKFDATTEGFVWESKINGEVEGEQRWLYSAKDKGTEVEMTLTSTVPIKAICIIADNQMIQKIIGNAFRHSLDNMKFFCENQ
jgi:uncharacterized membrane protein